LVADLARAAIACGADGLIIECHPEPEKSVSDARQALSLEDMIELVHSIVPIAHAVGRTMAGSSKQKRPHFSLISSTQIHQNQAKEKTRKLPKKASVNGR
jgi:3-deoxy-7-phosphoheptulonate synthase